LFWDDTNNRLGVGTNTPNTALQVVGQTTISSSDTFADLILSPSGAIYTGIKGRQYYIDIYSNATRVASWRYDGQSVNKLSVGGTVGNPMPTPQVQIQGSGSTSATTSLLVQNSAGTELLQLKDDGSVSFGTKVTISTAGTINASGNLYALGGSSVQVAPSGNFRFVGASQIWSDADGVMRLTDWAGTSFGSLRLGGTTSSFPALKRSTTNLQVRLADDSGYAPIDASLYKVGGTNGFTGTGSYTNFTIVGGIITNAS
jgi:hypothetical protein